MRTTIDKAGRIVIPRQLRDQVGLEPGEVEIVVDGAGVRIEPVARHDVVEEAGRLVIPSSDERISSDDVTGLRDADRR